MALEDEPDTEAAIRSLLGAVLGCLHPMEASVIQIHDGSCLGFEEIAEAIGLAPTAARAAWARGLKNLARISRRDLVVAEAFPEEVAEEGQPEGDE